MPVKSQITKLGEREELEFGRWYGLLSESVGINSDPDHPEQLYDYRGLYRKLNEDRDFADEFYAQGFGRGFHFPSQFKFDTHPNRFVPVEGGILDTKHDKLIKKKGKDGTSKLR